MVDVNVNNQGAWDFAGKLIDKFPLATMIITCIIIGIIVILGTWWAIVKIMNKGKLSEISDNVKAIKEHFVKK